MSAPRVLVVDDSSLMRQLLSRLLRKEGLDVVGTAGDGLEAIEKVQELRPDVVTLDVEMPRLDGLATLERLMAVHPVPVVMCSGFTREGAEATRRARQLGAVDVIAKPWGGQPVEEIGAELARKVRLAARAPIRRPPAPPREVAGPWEASRVIVIAASTGGPNALVRVIGALPADLGAALLVVQHMPVGFTTSLARRLDDRSALCVREAVDGDRPAAGLVLLAPGNAHLDLDAERRVVLSDAPPEHGVRPAADVTLRAVARAYPGVADVVVLTGMGSDGTAGARAVKATGGRVIAEAESTAAVWGMPRSIVEAGLADEVVPLDEVAGRIVALVARAPA
jgi:two-component system, chemotaxis family, protein-glutamate methylesterase/glutaminase